MYIFCLVRCLFFRCDAFDFLAEVQEMEENLPQSCKVQFDDPSVLHHFVLFITPDEGHWSGGVFKFDVKIPDDYNILVS